MVKPLGQETISRDFMAAGGRLPPERAYLANRLLIGPHQSQGSQSKDGHHVPIPLAAFCPASPQPVGVSALTSRRGE